MTRTGSRIAIGVGTFAGAALAATALLLGLLATPAWAETESDAALYQRLSRAAGGDGASGLIEVLNTTSRQLDWSRSQEKAFSGHLRVIRPAAGQQPAGQAVYLLRELTGNLYILAWPSNAGALSDGSGSP